MESHWWKSSIYWLICFSASKAGRSDAWQFPHNTERPMFALFILRTLWHSLFSAQSLASALVQTQIFRLISLVPRPSRLIKILKNISEDAETAKVLFSCLNWQKVEQTEITFVSFSPFNFGRRRCRSENIIFNHETFHSDKKLSESYLT